MKVKQPLSLSAAVLAASLTLGLPAAAIAQQASQQPSEGVRTIAVGHHVVDAVDDLRDATSDFVSAVLLAEEGRGIANWEQQEAKLMKIHEQLEQMEEALDKKARATDQEWLGWLGGPEYNVTVTRQLQGIASHLDEVSRILAETWQTPGIQVLVGSNMLEQLRDLAENVGDLMNAMEEAGGNYGWSVDPIKLQQDRIKLAQLVEDINKRRGMTDAEWQAYLESDQHHVVVNDNVAMLAEILKKLATPTQS